ncbi:MAG: zinc-ribbon domain-containing protein [Lachnospiraceae bacterium]|nr:zinc-ribbon domain-containing protein [Lachnospiraceae bacterium]
MFCKDCGQEIREGVKFCPYCGAVVGKQPEPMMNAVPDKTVVRGNTSTNSLEESKKAPVLGMGSFLGYRIIEMIPIVGFIVMIVFAVSSPNKNRENYARGYFLFLLVQIAVMIVMWMCKDVVWRIIYEILYSL